MPWRGAQGPSNTCTWSNAPQMGLSGGMWVQCELWPHGISGIPEAGGKPDPEPYPKHAAPRTPSYLPAPLRTLHAVSLNSQGSHVAFSQSRFRRRWGKSSHALALSLHFCSPESGTTAGWIGEPHDYSSTGQAGTTQESGSRNCCSGCAIPREEAETRFSPRALAPVLGGSLESDRCKGQSGTARGHREPTPHFSSGSDLQTPGSFGREAEKPGLLLGGGDP